MNDLETKAKNTPNGVLEWKNLEKLQFGKYAFSLVKEKFGDLGFQIKPFHGNRRQRFYAEGVKNKRLEIQVSSLRRNTDNGKVNTRICTSERLFDIDNDNLYMAAVIFENNPKPEIYLIPASILKNPVEPLFDYKTYPKAGPDYGINLSNNWQEDLKDYEITSVVTN